ncbi:SGNH/GDSL hydrolase family protein [Arthrobacter sp. NEB 688]|uniref:SGNH/GDSL hydrolase family protein n=1 Tax=Arthrobacter sp. NEB 688 TaxID=904039 RepID=UPI0015642DFE|nr:SGNH/GDSL hydrolase family protein [Arthrobacter sp. NEB 688]QKE84733.1 SGNH/GDSL hydrolase family protein [Arthrobacter sp. NEB 688]
MPDLDPLLGYANRTGRAPGRGVRALGLVLPGVRRVQGTAIPWADAWAAHNRTALTTPGRRWVVLGDSMSQAVGASAWDSGWVDRAAASLAGDGLPLVVVNLSATGARTADVVDQQLPVLRALPPALGTDAPDLVSVMVGSNDLFAGGGVRDRLPDEFARMVAALPQDAVVATLPQPRTAAHRANAHLEKAVARGALRAVDMRTEGPSSWRGRLAADLFHPNDAGYAELARAFVPHLRAALRATARD